MKSFSPLILLSLLHGALAGGNGLVSDCVLTKVLPTITTDCSENLSGATQQPGHPSASDFGHDSDSKPMNNGQAGSNTSAYVPGSTNAPQPVSGASIMVAQIRAEMVVTSLLAILMPTLMGLI